jgi:hypothetical protein
MRSERAGWEFREVRIDRAVSREEARAYLTASAETGNWELAQTRIYRDGRRQYKLKRRVYRVQRTA